jgi:acyl-coenzyme A synthetase/AMP-(fatty) acid ligase/pimeloyl-ACP methyl ester carboxylesterase
MTRKRAARRGSARGGLTSSRQGARRATDVFTAPATVPPPGITGIDPSWSRLILTPKLDDIGRTWHVLDNGVPDPAVTLLCVHGNPTWSYLWRSVFARADRRVRVVAVDQLEMGYSERIGTVRRLQQRVDDLCALTAQLDLSGRVVTLGHEWGGPISLGWAARHRGQLDGVVLANTAIHWPAGWRASALMRMALLPGVLKLTGVRTPSIIQAALELSRPRLAKPVRGAYHAPYSSARRRAGISAFVEDTPVDPSHPSAETMERLVADLATLRELRALLLWGPSDPLFPDSCLRDLEARLPRADVHRFVGASHLVPEVAEFAGAVHEWVAHLSHTSGATTTRTPRASTWAGLDRRRGDADLATIEMDRRGAGRSLAFAALDADVRRVAAGLSRHGVRSGDRVALLIPPGLDLTVCLYAASRMGAVVVLVDAGLGARGISRALKSSGPRFLIGAPRALIAARLLGWPGQRISAVDLPACVERTLNVSTTLEALREYRHGGPGPQTPADSDPAAVIFTSGATGPAKGVSYRHHQLQAQRDALSRVYEINDEDRLVAAFPPFAIYGPVLGIPSVVPHMRVTAPATLRAVALAEATEAIGGSLVFASPAALANVIATAGDLTPSHRASLTQVRLLLSAGAPVSRSILRRASEIMPNAEPHTPYGMTEVLPVSDITLAEIEAAGPGDGVCVGRPIVEVSVAISPLDSAGLAAGELTTKADTSGEVCVRAAHVKDSYDRLWLTQHLSDQPAHWHRSGDVGHLDHQGRLWIEGRMKHVLTTADGPVTPVGIEQAVESLPDVDHAAVVGVGPAGTQQVVVVVVPTDRPRRPELAEDVLAEQVRAVARVDVAAVLVVPALPLDIRHNSKIDRSRVRTWAGGVLAGRQMRAL